MPRSWPPAPRSKGCRSWISMTFRPDALSRRTSNCSWGRPSNAGLHRRVPARSTASRRHQGRAEQRPACRAVRTDWIDPVRLPPNCLISDPASLVVSDPATATRNDYERVILAGRFPLALARDPERSRDRWFRDFVTLVVERDVMEIRKVRQRQVLPQVLRRLADQTGQVVNVANIADAVGLDATTVKDYLGLLEAVFLIHRLEPFTRSAANRAIRSAKAHVVDTGLGAHLIGLTSQKLAGRLPAALTQFGHLVETFAVNELMKQAGWADQEVEFSHFRTRDPKKSSWSSRPPRAPSPRSRSKRPALSPTTTSPASGYYGTNLATPSSVEQSSTSANGRTPMRNASTSFRSNACGHPHGNDKTLSLAHHVAPVAGCVADRDEQRHVATPSFGEGLVAPLVPVDRVVGVLEQVRGRGISQPVHGPQPLTR